MSKRGHSFQRRPHDSYLTIDPAAVRALLPHLEPSTRFSEPCCGEGHLVADLTAAGHVCVQASDLAFGVDALTLGQLPAPVITNPPWSRGVLHGLISHWLMTAPYAWLLFDAGWVFTAQAAPLIPLCTDVVPTPRLQWIADSLYKATDDSCWYRFDIRARGPGPVIHPVRATGRTARTPRRPRAPMTANGLESRPELH